MPLSARSISATAISRLRNRLNDLPSIMKERRKTGDSTVDSNKQGSEEQQNQRPSRKVRFAFCFFCITSQLEAINALCIRKFDRNRSLPVYWR